MSLALTHPRIAEHNGLWYLLGYSGGSQYIKKSADHGQSWLEFSDGSQQKEIGPSDDAAGAIVKMTTQGSRIVVAIPKEPDVHIYVTADDGETWELESTVGMG